MTTYRHLFGESEPKIILIRGKGRCVLPITTLYLILEHKCMCNAQKYYGKHVNLKSIYFYSTQFCSRSSSWKAYPLVINIPVNQKPENSHQRCCI